MIFNICCTCVPTYVYIYKYVSHTQHIMYIIIILFYVHLCISYMIGNPSQYLLLVCWPSHRCAYHGKDRIRLCLPPATFKNCSPTSTRCWMRSRLSWGHSWRTMQTWSRLSLLTFHSTCWQPLLYHKRLISKKDRRVREGEEGSEWSLERKKRQGERRGRERERERERERWKVRWGSIQGHVPSCCT